jgi:hypothetical protein
VDTVGYRASKFEHKIDEAFGFSQEEAAIICLLLLRGAQTPGEIRTRSGRLCDFDSPAQVEQVLEKLAEMENGPFVKKLPRQPGKRESRYIHLFRGEPEPGEENDLSVQSDFNSVSVPAPFYSEKISALEAEVGELREKLENLEAKFEAFVKEFE